MGDAAAAAMQKHDPSDHRPKSTLMRKLSSLLQPKKSKPPKPAGYSAQRPPALPPSLSQAATVLPGSELELLFAQAEATLGELLVRAGASFQARSSSYNSHADQPHRPHPRAGCQSHTVDDDVSTVISSGSRSAKFSGKQAHARRRSLSRVWQQLGGSLFCGSAHMSAFVMDQDMMMAPAPSKGVSDDVVLDEAYWQSLADAMLLQQRQQEPDAKQAADCGSHEPSSRGDKEVQGEDQRGVQYAEHVQEEEDRGSEIVPSMDGDSILGIKLWALCGSTSSTGSVSLQDMGCARLNTTLDESPNLAHNYLRMKEGGTPASTYSCPEAEVVNESVVSSSNSASMQPLERFLQQAARNAAVRASSRSAPEIFDCLEPVGVELPGTTSCRVSLLTLLHEEAAAAESATPLEEEEEAEATAAPAAANEEVRAVGAMRSMAQVGEDPLQCCVCMIRRKGAALIPCGHTFCRICAKQLFAGRGACPLCNNLIVQVLDIF